MVFIVALCLWCFRLKTTATEGNTFRYTPSTVSFVLGVYEYCYSSLCLYNSGRALIEGRLVLKNTADGFWYKSVVVFAVC